VKGTQWAPDIHRAYCPGGTFPLGAGWPTVMLVLQRGDGPWL